MIRFEWIDRNRAHVARHGVGQREVEQGVRQRNSTHYVRSDGTVVTCGRTRAGRRLRVVRRAQPARDIFADMYTVIFVITACEVGSR